MREQTAPAPAQQGLLRSLLGIIVRPRVTLEYLKERGGRAWWVPALLAALLLVVPILVVAPITAQQTREAILATQEQMEEQQGAELSAEQRDQMTSIAASPLITVVFPVAAGVVGLVVGWLVWSGGLYLVGMALGGRSTFGGMLRMVVWTWIPYVLRGLLQTVYILATGQVVANPGLSGLVQDSSRVGEMTFASPGLGQMLLAGFLSRIDLFLVWNLALLVTGVMVVTRLPRRKAVLATLVVWLLLTALGLTPALIGGLFAQQVGGP